MLKDIHTTGNASVKLRRLKDLANLIQRDESHEAFISRFNDVATSVVLHLESSIHPGYIHLGHLLSLHYLAGLNRAYFQPILDQLLAGNPSGLFDNLPELQSEIQIWKTSRQISMSDETTPSEQGQALHTNQITYYPPNDPPNREISATKYRDTARCFFTALHNNPQGHGTLEADQAFQALYTLCEPQETP
jgi:hypothetical protein